MNAIDRQFLDSYDAAVQLLQDDQYEAYIAAVRALLADSAKPRYFRIKCLMVLGTPLGDWTEAHGCYIEAETIWRVTKQWHREKKTADPEIMQALDDLQEGLDELKKALVNDEDGRRESIQDADTEAAMLRTLAAHNARVEEDHAIAETKGETWSGEELSDEEEMSEDDEMSDIEEAASAAMATSAEEVTGTGATTGAEGAAGVEVEMKPQANVEGGKTG